MSLFESASLVVTPNGIKASKLYAIKPTDGSGDLSVVRATSATRVDANGLIEIPRTNLLRYSEQFDNPAWSKSAGVTVTANDGISPDGTMNADRIVFTGVNQFVNQFNSLSAVAHYGSVYVKGTLGETIRFVVGGTEATRTLTGEWQRIELLRATAPSNGNFTISTFSSATARDILIWGSQLEAGNSATEYIPTTSSIRTKFAGITQDGSSALNIPRLDYTNGSCPSILVEPQRTNLLERSEEFENASWSKLNISVTSNSGVSPNGTTTADKIIPSATPSFKEIYNDSSLTSGVVYTQTYYVKADGYRYIQILSPGVNTGTMYANFDLQTATKTDGTLGYGSIQSVGNGWCKITSTFTQLVTGIGRVSISIIPNSNSARVASWTANGTDGILVWGAQLEAGANATSYIPTVASTSTRNADVISKTGISSLIGQTEGTMFFDLKSIANNNFKRLSINGGSYVNSIFFDFDNSNNLYLKVFNSGSAVITLLASGVNIANRNKIAIAYKNNDFSFYVNGTQVASQSSGSVPSGLANYEFSLAGNEKFEGNINTTALWKTRLTNDELATLTTI